jgi:4-amino-4-deoxy-L-arabinose transferase-like glycosyltransferase
MFGLPFIKPPHPDTLRAWSTFWQALRMIFHSIFRRIHVIGSLLEARAQRFGLWLMDKKPRLTLVILALLWLLPGNAQLPLIDRDEPRFAYATQEMIDRGDNFVPTFNGEWRFDKPPLVYWWMRAHYMIFGYHDFSARLHSVEATILVVLLVFGFASRMYDKKVGFWSAFAFLTCLQTFLHGRLCVADMPMMVFIVAAQWAAWELLKKGTWFWNIVFWGSVALGFTTKWIVPPAVVGLGVLVFCALTKRWPPVKNFKPIFGVLFFCAIILAWAIPAWMETNGDFFKVGIGEHVFVRGLEAFNKRGYTPFFYLLTAFVSLMPWMAFAGGMFANIKNQWDARLKYLLGSTAIIYLVFSLAQTQLMHYVLPAFPLFIIALVGVTKLELPIGKWARRFFHFVSYAGVVIFSLMVLVAWRIPVHGHSAVLKWAGLTLGISLLSLTLLGRFKARGQFIWGSIAFICVPLFFHVSVSMLSGLLPAQQVAKILDPTNMPTTLIATGYEEPSLVSYSQAHWVYEADTAKAFELYEKSPKVALVALSQEFSLESIPSILLKKPVKPRRDLQKALLSQNPSGRHFYMGGVNLGRFSWIRYEVYLKP